MPGSKNLFVFGFFLTLMLCSCGTENQNINEVQQAINAQAFNNRLGRESTPDEVTGIQLSTESSSTPAAKPNWKMILMTGDDSIKAFDNARKKLFGLFTEYGIDEGIQLSRSPSQQVNGVKATSIANLEKASKDLNIKDGDGCLLFMTSHGSPQGFFIKDQSFLTPTKLNQIIKDSCGARPTVLLVSACYSGIFAEPSMQAPNRIILTAARKDKTSFGCGAEEVYTYWDACLVSSLPNAKTWFELSEKIEKCIETKEGVGNFARSYPQARFGADVKDLEIRQ